MLANFKMLTIYLLILGDYKFHNFTKNVFKDVTHLKVLVVVQ